MAKNIHITLLLSLLTVTALSAQTLPGSYDNTLPTARPEAIQTHGTGTVHDNPFTMETLTNTAAETHSTRNMQNSESTKLLQYCNEVKTLATIIMDSRQNSVNMSETVTDRLSTLQIDIVQSIVMGMIVEAYETQVYTVYEIKQSTIKDFGNHNYLKCIKTVLE